MRKLLGGILAIVAALFLGLAYTQLAIADDKDKACRDELTKRILELVESDQSDILEKQFELTTLKLAEVTVESGSTTVEDYFRTQENVIAKLDEAGVQKKLISLYRKYGESDDQAEVIARYEASKKLARKGSYWRPSTRFKNQDLSAFAYAHTFLHQAQSPFRAEDVAILWLQAEISEAVTAKAGRGSAPANMTEVSTLVARLGGAISGVAGKDLDALRAAKKNTEDQLGAAFDKVVDQFREQLAKVCPELNKDGKVCADCKIAEETRIGALGEAIHKVQEKLRVETGAKDAMVEKVITEMKAKGYEVKLGDPSEKGDEEPAELKGSPAFQKMMDRHYASFTGEMKKPLEFRSFRLGAESGKKLFDFLPSTTIGIDSVTTQKGLTDEITDARGKPGAKDSVISTKAASDTLPSKTPERKPPVASSVSIQDTGLSQQSTLFFNHDFSYTTPTRKVANEAPLLFFDKPMPWMDSVGCTVHWLGVENGDKASMRFELRHDQSGAVYCSGKVNMPSEDDKNPGQTLAFRFLHICSMAKTSLLTTESCKGSEAPKK